MKFLALLTSATLFGGMMLYSFGFAPLVFKTLAIGEAGRMLRRAFRWYYLFILGCAAAGALLMFPFDSASALIMGAVAGTAILARQGLMPQINAARDRQLSGDMAARKRFARLHGASVLLNFVQLLGVAAVLFRFA